MKLTRSLLALLLFIAPAIYAQAPGGTTLKTIYVEFVSRFRDGSLIQTNNSDQLRGYPESNLATNHCGAA